MAANTDVPDFITDLDGGVFEKKVGRALSDVAAAVMDYERKGKVTITLDVSKLSSSQVNVEHNIKYEHPTLRGTKTENDKTATPMHVGTGGRMSFFPEDQGQMFGKQGQVAQGDSIFPQNKTGTK